jgi:hypothetical protein
MGSSQEWRPISREEALRLAARGLPVRVLPGCSGALSPLDRDSPYWQANGPYDYASLSYFVATGFGTPSRHRPQASAQLLANTGRPGPRRDRTS